MFNSRKLEQRAHWIFPAPAVLAVVIAVVFPLFYTIWMSFHNWSGQSTQDPIWIGLDNYRQALLHDHRFWGAVIRTLYFTALALTFQVTTGVAIAVLMHREFPGRSIFRTIMLLPMVTTPVVVALTWTLILNPIQGIGPYLWNDLGLSQVEWLANPRVVILTLALVDTWQWTPLIALITLAGLASLPTEPLEASIIDGANAWQTFWHITLPLLRPAIMVATLFRAIDAIKTFDIIFAMTQGGPGNASETLNIYVFQMAFSYQRIGFASALLVLFFILVLMISLVLIRLRRSSW